GTHDLRQRADAAYHVYAVEWDDSGIRWFVDDVQFYAVTRAQVEARGPWVFDQPFFLLLNVAVGGSWPGSPDAGSVFPQRMYVDWVRVHQTVERRRRDGSQPLAPPRASARPAAQMQGAKPIVMPATPMKPREATRSERPRSALP